MESPIPRKPKSSLPKIAVVLRSRPVNKSLRWLERRTEGKPMRSQNVPVATAPRLSGDLLRRLLENQLLAIHVPGYCPGDVCDTMAAKLQTFDTRNWNVSDVSNTYKNSDVEVVGHPFNTAMASDEAWKDYFENGTDVTSRIRGAADPLLSPLDRLRLELDEIYPYGLQVKRHGGRRMTPGLVRVMNGIPDAQCDELPLNCHVDTAPLVSNSAGLFSANVYLRPAEQGGHLVIWDPDITTPMKLFANWSAVKNFFLCSNLLDREIQGAFQALLPKYKKIEIKQGDLVLINTSRPHATTAMSGGPRISIQSFIDYRKRKPLEMWA